MYYIKAQIKCMHNSVADRTIP